MKGWNLRTNCLQFRLNINQYTVLLIANYNPKPFQPQTERINFISLQTQKGKNSSIKWNSSPRQKKKARIPFPCGQSHIDIHTLWSGSAVCFLGINQAKSREAVILSHWDWLLRIKRGRWSEIALSWQGRKHIIFVRIST